ncbi:MAG: FxsA family protein [Planctomycetes bacterium]|nr:FxsA family protein [Planctomycetota bacterium]
MLQLLLLFTIIPLMELWLFVQFSGAFGFWTTFALVIGTGMAGAALARWQGWQALERVRTEMRQGMLPAQAIGDGVLIFAAGLLLITPGVLTDVLGLSLLIPPLRKLVLKGLRHWFTTHVRVKTDAFYADQTGAPPPGRSTIVDARVIDAEVVDAERDEPLV